MSISSTGPYTRHVRQHGFDIHDGNNNCIAQNVPHHAATRIIAALTVLDSVPLLALQRHMNRGTTHEKLFQLLMGA